MYSGIFFLFPSCFHVSLSFFFSVFLCLLYNLLIYCVVIINTRYMHCFTWGKSPKQDSYLPQHFVQPLTQLLNKHSYVQYRCKRSISHRFESSRECGGGLFCNDCCQLMKVIYPIVVHINKQGLLRLTGAKLFNQKNIEIFFKNYIFLENNL